MGAPLAELLVVEDGPTFRQFLSDRLSPTYKVHQAGNGPEALRILQENDICLVLLDLILGEENGLDLIPKIKEIDEFIEVVVLTGVRDVKTIVQAMRMGAFDYLLKESPEEIEHVLVRARARQNDRRQILYLRSELEGQITADAIKTHNPEMKTILNLLKKVAPQDITALVEGESGTGKELVARMIHQMSPRHNKPFVTLNMAAIPTNLMESLLFGHEKGAFTGADHLQRGKFELAHGGTLFLDEVGDLPLETQPKLLRVLQEGEIERVGGYHTIPVDVRLIAATNRDLEEMVREGTFRGDLYYRLHVIPIRLPSLRQRSEDISRLVRHFLGRYGKKFGKKISGVAKDVMKLFEKYPWPGNIRELEHLCERIAVSIEGPLITMKDLPPGFGALGASLPSRETKEPAVLTTLEEAEDNFEKNYLEAALKDQHWHQAKTAQILGIHRKTLEAKIKKFRLSKPRHASSRAS